MLEAGEAVATDFGIARAIDTAGAEHLTRTGTAVGTPAYMSPERAAGGSEVEVRSDLYALGCAANTQRQRLIVGGTNPGRLERRPTRLIA